MSLIPGPRTQHLTRRQLSSAASAVAQVDKPDFQHHRYNQTITLPDGRKLGYAEAGSPTGYPLFFFHGSPGSRLEVRGLEDIGRRHNIRVIATDRPGYGLSTYHPTLAIADWPADVHCLARHLALKRFAVLGGSGGGPYALACAHALPSEMLSSVGLLCSAAPWDDAATKSDVLLWARIGFWAATNCPSLATGVINFVVGLARRLANTAIGKSLMDTVVAKAIQTAGKEVPAGETTQQTVAERRERAVRVFLEPFAQGAQGFVRDAFLLTHPYGFRLEDVEQTIHVWHGTKDVNSPIRMVRRMAERLPNCEMREMEGETHFTIIKYLDEVVTTLVPADVSNGEKNA